MHMELRVRSVYELVCYRDHYLQPDVVSPTQPDADLQRPTNAALHVFSANYQKAYVSSVGSGSDYIVHMQETFNLDCLETAIEGTYCNMWHIHALSSVLNCPIRAIYPDVNHKIRHFLNRIVIPRQGCNDIERKLIYVMWTHTTMGLEALAGGQWSPNHFIPCVPQATCMQSVTVSTSASVFPTVSSMGNTGHMRKQGICATPHGAQAITPKPGIHTSIPKPRPISSPLYLAAASLNQFLLVLLCTCLVPIAL